MGKYRKKPIAVEAIQITQENVAAIAKMEGVVVFTDGPFGDSPKGAISWVEVHTLEGNMLGYPGDWIIVGVAGEVHPCKDEIFRKTYEPVEDDTANG